MGVRSLLLLLALAAAGTWGVIRHLPESRAQAEAIGSAGPQQIQGVALDGRDLPLAALREQLVTTPGSLIDLSRLTRDRAVLEEVLVERGYLAAKVDDARVTYSPAGVYVTFPVAQGPMFRIRDVKITGASAAAAGVVTLASGETADTARITQARQALEARLGVRTRKSLVLVKMVPELAAGMVDVELAVTP